MNNSGIKELLSKVAPGSELRKGIYNILDAGIGALIVIGYDEEIEKVRDGGFYINCDYTPERIYELSKMDGAIIVDENCERILYANVHIQADKSYSTTESGTRHRTAERAAKQLKKGVIAVSERRKAVTIFQGDFKYRLKNLEELYTEASQVLKTLERYRYVLDRELDNLTILELDDLVTIYDVAKTLQRFEMIRRIKEDIDVNLLEFGTEGRIISLQVAELVLDLDKEEESFLKDYINDGEDIVEVKKYLKSLTDTELLEMENLSFALGYNKSYSSLDNKVSARGYRTLGKISKLTKKDIEKIVATKTNLAEIQELTDEDFGEIKISKFKVKALKTGINRLRFTSSIAE
ncbi:MAG: DNA integrity scanning diadenylate cyclase DisA [Fusobacterium gastrosuis]|uniref:DNA integrity scanning diadenylate cyclase DisA n=1 Tax=Fusobacterium TaxID=848 RepID=UPI001F500811|nr:MULTISPECIES: DNA integrity scanning diadenylate cyclase DisA [Fusobacterium]MDD7391496.1 DNA integrity scanning diadenylate cyclase DisA [Fusobacteriaceae bacterium]MCI5724801.1 DNA integrity scanning diadenylate cyclase DisA [Fusobacterium sp.]MCI7223821.1 DNA integrity scanning diadenylate cyclase DisA [Fusobacterium sp.]MDD7410289.1 DNA integrity scanning diadenylate cyclase DisA [Fusobacteriaceae bacterium]MDY4010592.1 DNA integrity scanning diadenylate cyclase DisA [Fusobacterium gast